MRPCRVVKVLTVAVAVAAVSVYLTSCATGGTGARDEGPARGDSAAGAAVVSPSPTASPATIPKRVDPVQLVKNDPAVSADVKADLRPCVSDEYPVDVSYGDLTGGRVSDVVVNVMTCSDAVGVGSYVYREVGSTYKNVFTSEESPVYAEIDRGDLVVTEQVYEKSDPLQYPSGEVVTTYRWSVNRFAVRNRTENDYSNAVGAVTPIPESN
nr:hypothetical protein [Streptomyces cavernae]